MKRCATQWQQSEPHAEGVNRAPPKIRRSGVKMPIQREIQTQFEIQLMTAAYSRGCSGGDRHLYRIWLGPDFFAVFQL